MRWPTLLLLGLGLTGTPKNATAQGFHWIGQVERDAEGLDSKDPQDRIQSIQRLSQYSIGSTKKFLTEAVEDQNSSVKAAAGRTLAKGKLVEFLPIAKKWLSNPSIELRQAGADMLGSFGRAETLPALIRSLSDPDDGVRLRIVDAIVQIGTKRAVVPLIGRLEDKNPAIRSAAVTALAAIGDRRAVVPLVGLFDDPSSNVRTGAIRAVGTLDDDSAVPALVRLLRDPSDPIRGNAASALGTLGSARAVDALLRSMEQGTTTFRSIVIFSLGQIVAKGTSSLNTDRIIAALLRALESQRLHGAAEQALEVAGKAAVPALSERLRNSRGTTLTSLVKILGKSGDSRATPSLVDELDRGRVDKRIVLNAIEAAADRRALVPALSLLSDPDPELRYAAIRSVRRLLSPEGKVLDLIYTSLNDSDPRVVALAAEQLGKNRFKQADKKLIGLFTTSTDLNIIRSSAYALGEIRSKRAIAHLSKALSSSNERVRPVIADALLTIGTEKALEALSLAAEKGTSGSRADAIFAMGGIVAQKPRKRWSAFFEEMVARPGTAQRVAALQALGAFGGNRAAPKSLKNAASSANNDLRTAALLSIAEYRGGAAPLVAALKSNQERISAAAALGLANRRKLTKSAAAALRRSLVQGHSSAVNASASLVRHGAVSAKKLTGMLSHPHPLVRTNAMFGLRHKKETRPSFVRLMMDDPSPLVRAMAARVLRAPVHKEFAKKHLAKALATEKNSSVKKALRGPFLKSRSGSEWKAFRIVTPSTGEPALRREYYLVSDFGLSFGYDSNANGIIVVPRYRGGTLVSNELIN